MNHQRKLLCVPMLQINQPFDPSFSNRGYDFFFSLWVCVYNVVMSNAAASDRSKPWECGLTLTVGAGRHNPTHVLSKA